MVDLALLLKRVLKISNETKNHHEREALLALIDKRRAELQTEARFLGERIYAEKPTAFADRIHQYWQSWQEEQKIEPLAAH